MKRGLFLVLIAACAGLWLPGSRAQTTKKGGVLSGIVLGQNGKPVDRRRSRLPIVGRELATSGVYRGERKIHDNRTATGQLRFAGHREWKLFGLG